MLSVYLYFKIHIFEFEHLSRSCSRNLRLRVLLGVLGVEVQTSIRSTSDSARYPFYTASVLGKKYQTQRTYRVQYVVRSS